MRNELLEIITRIKNICWEAPSDYKQIADEVMAEANKALELLYKNDKS